MSPLRPLAGPVLLLGLALQLGVWALRLRVYAALYWHWTPQHLPLFGVLGVWSTCVARGWPARINGGFVAACVLSSCLFLDGWGDGWLPAPWMWFALWAVWLGGCGCYVWVHPLLHPPLASRHFTAAPPPPVVAQRAASPRAAQPLAAAHIDGTAAARGVERFARLGRTVRVATHGAHE